MGVLPFLRYRLTREFPRQTSASLLRMVTQTGGAGGAWRPGTYEEGQVLTPFP